MSISSPPKNQHTTDILHRERDMKLWEITHVIEGVTMIERVEADTKMQARGVLVRHYLRQLDLVSVELVEESEATA